jgi:8-oxo-dGTP pyrophosphatase MutT (NUDIX family)
MNHPTEYRVRDVATGIAANAAADIAASVAGRQHSALTRELHEETGLVITAAHAPLLVWVQTVAFPSTQEHGYAELGWKVLAKLVASELATKTDSDVIQVIAEHAALGEQATDEGGPSVGSEGDA